MRSDRWTINSAIAGAGGGLTASVATCPLDVIKTKLQAQRASHGDAAYRGVLGTAKHIFQHEGIRGLYRGLGPTILGYLPTWAIFFTVYDGIKTHFGETPLGFSSDTRGRKGEIYPAAQVKGYQPATREQAWSLHILSAMCAGAASTICTNPLWVIKTRFMTQSLQEGRYRNTQDAFLTIYRSEGIPAFYRGLFPSLLGLSHVAVQFPLYEQLKIWAQGNSDDPLPSHKILACSGTAKMVASITTYPHEVVRTRLQTLRRPLASNLGSVPGSPYVDGEQRGGVINTTKLIVQREGWRGLYKGFSVNLIRTVPNSAVTLLTYELLMRMLDR